jgi:hypothetical protein
LSTAASLRLASLDHRGKEAHAQFVKRDRTHGVGLTRPLGQAAGCVTWPAASHCCGGRGLGLADAAAFLADPRAERVAGWREALDAEVADRRRLLDHIARLTDLQGDHVPDTDDTPTGTTGAPAVLRAVPVLASLDLDATQRFYAERLGFDRLFTYPDYAVSGRDGVQVHFSLTDDARVLGARRRRQPHHVRGTAEPLT